ncbi:unnamed protein product [Schistosoma haematobium]|nr:unnamed protein product [Schistosoma haematobium]
MKNIQSLTSNSSYTREGYDEFIRNTLTHFNLVGHLLNICLINARSICNKKTDLALFVSIYQPSVIMISEAWTNSNISDRSISLDNYSLYRSDRLNGRGGGCLIYAHSSLNSLLCDMPELNTLKDSVWIVLKPSNSVTLLLGCVYRQPNASIDEIAVLSEVFTLASSLSFTGKLICGDFNMPEISWLPVKAPRRYESFIECLELGQWTQYVDSPTRHQNILDLVFTSGLIPNTLYIGKKFPGSDHNIVICSLNVKTTTDRSKTVTLRRNYRKVDWNNFHNYLRSTDWRTFFTSNNTDTLTNIFYHNIKSIINNIAPLEYCKPTFSKDLYIPVSTRRRLQRHCTRFHNLNDFSSLVTMTEILARTEAISKQKAVAQEKRAVELNNNSSALTILLQNKLKRSKSRGSIFIKGKQVYEDPKLITELFSEHFCFSLTNEKPFNDSEPIPVTPCEITNVEFSVQNISKAISTLKHSYTDGPDGIPSSMLKRGGDDMCVLLLKLFAISLSSACYPTAWKTTHIIPKIKTGPEANVENYRPINITSVVSRVMEKVVKAAVVQHLLTNNLLSTSQHGFLRSRSCDTCLVDYLNDITLKRDSGLLVSVLFLDFKKAFDKVPHKRLLVKLKSFGIHNPLHSWFASFLTERKQMVKYNDCLSSPRPITSGVIQGSVLGPLLFLMYINDICNTIEFGKPYLYADDLKIVYSYKPETLSESVSQIQKDLNNLTIWSEKWQLPFNLNKCGIMHFGKHPYKPRLHLNECIVQTLESVHDLGIKYTGSLNFEEHASSIISKSRRLIGFIMKNFFTTEGKLTLYKICVRPTLEYCSFVFSNMNIADKIRVENVQRRFTRQLLGCNSNLDYTDRCKHLSLEPLWHRRLKHNLIFLYKAIYGLSFLTSCPTITHDPAYRLRNNAYTLLTVKHQKQMRCKFFTVRYSLLWNRLPMHTRNCDTFTRFKKLINLFLDSKELQHYLELPPTDEALYYGPPSI